MPTSPTCRVSTSIRRPSSAAALRCASPTRLHAARATEQGPTHFARARAHNDPHTPHTPGTRHLAPWTRACAPRARLHPACTIMRGGQGARPDPLAPRPPPPQDHSTSAPLQPSPDRVTTVSEGSLAADAATSLPQLMTSSTSADGTAVSPPDDAEPPEGVLMQPPLRRMPSLGQQAADALCATRSPPTRRSTLRAPSACAARCVRLRACGARFLTRRRPPWAAWLACARVCV